jgi:hypothetical protein
MELVARKQLKGGALFKSSLEKGDFVNLGQNSRKQGYILSSQNLNRVPFSPPVTTRKGIILKPFSHMGTQLETK